MPNLDLFTLDLVTIANLLATSAAMFLIWTLNKRVHGIRRCAMGSLLLCLGFAAVPLRFYFHDKIVILFPNLLVFAGELFVLDGVRAFREFRRETKLYVLYGVAFACGMCYWLFVRDSMSSRVAVGSVFWAIGALWCARSMALGVPLRDRGVYWSTAAIFAVEGGGLLIRAAHALTHQPDVRGFMPGPVDTLAFFTLNLATIGCAFGLSMATNLKLQRETERLAFHDVLTNLPNRRMFEERLEQADRRAFGTGHPIALIYCDLDDFKGINDTLGHEGGDMALRMVGQRLGRVVTDDICLARVGGDEFVLLIEDARARQKLLDLIDRLRNAVEGVIEFDGRSATLKISCGLAVYPEDVGSVSDLIRLADAGMYMMKKHGRFPPAAEIPAAYSGQGRSI